MKALPAVLSFRANRWSSRTTCSGRARSLGEGIGPPIVSAVGVPLHGGTTPIGAITLHSTDPGHRFTMSDAHVLELFADLAMLALSHVSLCEEVRTLNKRLGRRVRERTRALQRSTEEILAQERTA